MAHPSAEELAMMQQYPLGETTLGALSDFADEVRACLVRFGMSRGLTRDDVLTATEHALNYGNGRKMVAVGLDPGPFWDVSFVKTIQSEILFRHKDWSVVLSSCSEEPGLEIFAGEVRECQGEVVSNLAGRLERMRLECEAHKEMSRGWYRRQGTVLKKQLPESLPRLTNEIPFVLMGIFSRYRKYGDNVAWLLTAASDFDIYLQTMVDEAVQAGSRFYVDADSNMTEKRWKYVDGERLNIDVQWTVEGWLIPKEYRRDQLVVAQDEREIDGVTRPARQWQIPFLSSQVIHD